MQCKNILFGASNIISCIEFINFMKPRYFLLSLDFVKAYDRVDVRFVVLVLLKMNFGYTFANWILMLHKGATTTFILGVLTSEILVSFSICQGDPLAMLLYIIYVEPLLLLLERSIFGLHIRDGLYQKIEAYCDDIQIMSNDEDDLVGVDRVIAQFEMASGALLSRTKKCKILGLGSWKGREIWPLSYIKSVDEIKIFGEFMLGSFNAIMKRNWDVRFDEFRSAVFAWDGRMITSLDQRVMVLKTFALSRIWYLAVLLPIV